MKASKVSVAKVGMKYSPACLPTLHAVPQYLHTRPLRHANSARAAVAILFTFHSLPWQHQLSVPSPPAECWESNVYNGVTYTRINTRIRFQLHVKRVQKSGSYKMPAACSQWLWWVSRQYHPKCFIMRSWAKCHEAVAASSTVYVTSRLPLPRPGTW
jgi:hypothetical protein